MLTLVLWEGPASPSRYLNLTSQFTHYVDNGVHSSVQIVELHFFFLLPPAHGTKWGEISVANYN